MQTEINVPRTQTAWAAKSRAQPPMGVAEPPIGVAEPPQLHQDGLSCLKYQRTIYPQ